MKKSDNKKLFLDKMIRLLKAADDVIIRCAMVINDLLQDAKIYLVAFFTQLAIETFVHGESTKCNRFQFPDPAYFVLTQFALVVRLMNKLYRQTIMLTDSDHVIL